MSSDSTRLLVAGLGNVFLGDDAFGVEVVNRLRATGVPPDVRVMDVGVRTVHLAYELREHEYDTLILVDTVSQGLVPGTVSVLEPEDDKPAAESPAADGHALAPHHVLALVRQLGGRLPRVIIVGCEPSRIGPDAGLSLEVEGAVDAAVECIRRLVSATPAAAAAS